MPRIKEEDAEYLEKVETYSLPTLQRNATPRARGGAKYDNEPAESVSERFWALSGIFPASVRCFANKVADLTVRSARGLYVFTCNASWIIFTGTVILFAPLIFETERANNEERSKTTQTTVLTGANRTVTGPPPTLPLIR